MASKKDFLRKKPEMQIQAEAVEAFLVNSPAPATPAEPAEPVKQPAKKKPAAITEPEHTEAVTEASNVPGKVKRDKRLQLVITSAEAEYLSAIAWIKRTSVNDYMNKLIEQDMQKNPDALQIFKGVKNNG